MVFKYNHYSNINRSSDIETYINIIPDKAPLTYKRLFVYFCAHVNHEKFKFQKYTSNFQSESRPREDSCLIFKWNTYLLYILINGKTVAFVFRPKPVKVFSHQIPSSVFGSYLCAI